MKTESTILAKRNTLEYDLENIGEEIEEVRQQIEDNAFRMDSHDLIYFSKKIAQLEKHRYTKQELINMLNWILQD